MSTQQKAPLCSISPMSRRTLLRYGPLGLGGLKKQLLIGLAHLLLALGLCQSELKAADAGESKRKPNILFIMTDDWGWGDMSLRKKSPYVRTPNLDKFFAQGTEFTQFHVNSPVCSPSRAALYTGQFPGRNKVFYIYDGSAEATRKYGNNDWLDPEVTMLPRLMTRLSRNDLDAKKFFGYQRRP